MAQRIVEHRAPLDETVLELQEHIARSRTPLTLAALIVAAGLAPVLALVLVHDVPLDTLTRDIFAITESRSYTGLLSNLGIVFWAAAAAVWLLCAAMLGRVAPGHSLLPLAFWAGLYTLWLLADDALMLHEELLPRLLGVSEGVLMVAYGASALAMLALGAGRIMRTNVVLCLAAGGLFAGSMVVDRVAQLDGMQLLVEDGLKFAGIVVWCAYAVDTTLRLAERLYARR